MKKENSHWYASGVLNFNDHKELVADIEFYAEQAGINPIEYTKPISKVCKDNY